MEGGFYISVCKNLIVPKGRREKLMEELKNWREWSPEEQAEIFLIVANKEISVVAVDKK